MNKVTVIIATEKQAFPIGTIAGNWAVSISKEGAVVTTEHGTNVVYEFVLAAGNYSAQAVRLTETGEALGPVAVTTFEVIDEPVEVLIDVAQSVSATVS